MHSKDGVCQLAKDKVIELARLVTKYTGKMTVNIVSFTEIQEAIRDNCPEEFFTLIMRRFMMEISARIVKWDACGALITGENLGQVSCINKYEVNEMLDLVHSIDPQAFVIVDENVMVNGNFEKRL